MTQKLDPALLDVGKGKGRLGGLRPPYGVVGSKPCLGNELPDVMPGSEKTKPQREEKGWRMGRGAPEKTSAPDNLEKELCGGHERGQGRTRIGKC